VVGGGDVQAGGQLAELLLVNHAFGQPFAVSFQFFGVVAH